MLTDKSPTLRGSTCQGVLGLVFHRFPGTSIRLHYMPVKRAECFPFRDFLLRLLVQVGVAEEMQPAVRQQSERLATEVS